MRRRCLASSAKAGSLAETGVAATLTLPTLFCSHPSCACGFSPQVIALVVEERSAVGFSTVNVATRIATSKATRSESRIILLQSTALSDAQPPEREKITAEFTPPNSRPLEGRGAGEDIRAMRLQSSALLRQSSSGPMSG